jgi:Carboxypeptidase regulatory-like domain
MRGLVTTVIVLLTWIVFVPSAARAQAVAEAAIAGVVRDTSGAVLPGVTVEASSPVMIEKVRSSVTDGSGQYRIVGLRPGVYAVTFTLAGFNTVRREGIELTGSFNASVNAEMKVGAVTETITVTGETPIVDVQSGRKDQTLSNDVITSMPIPRVYHAIVTLVPGVTSSGTQDVGGISGPTTVTFSIHGGRAQEGRLLIDGLSIGGAQAGSGVSFYVPDVGNAQEVTFSTSGGLGESEVGGPMMNIIPRQGGNEWAGTVFANGANGAMASSNYTTDLQNAGLKAPNELLKIWDLNGVYGGPLRKDSLWIYGGERYQGNRKSVAGMYYNVNAGNPAAWTYVPDLTRQARDDGTWTSTHARLTWAATPRNKLQFYADSQTVCTGCIYGGSATISPEAGTRSDSKPMHLQTVSWTSPVSNRLLLEARFGSLRGFFGAREPDPNPTLGLIRLTEQCSAGCPANGGIPGLVYRSVNWSHNRAISHRWVGTASYVTGAHSMKVGYLGQWQDSEAEPFQSNYLAYQVNNGVPNQLTMSGGPFNVANHLLSTALYAQDQSTFGRLTLQVAVRYDRASSYFPAGQVGPTQFIPVPLIYPGQPGVTGYNDITPRISSTYDVFGNGRTAFKVNLAKYLEAATNGVNYSGPNPLSRITTVTTRSFNDANKNFAPDCNLLNPAANGECGAMSSQTFGQNVFSNTYDPAILHGWGVRPADWNLGVAVQQQILPRASLEVGYYRRWFSGFTVTDNLAVAPSDFGLFSVTAPQDPRLPGGGGNVVSGLYNVNPNKFGQVNNFITYSDRYGNQYQHFNGVEINLNVRALSGLTFQGGSSTGQTVSDSCAVRAQLPETALLNPFCHVATGFLTQVRGLSSYTIAKVGVQVSATFQSNPGSPLAANYVASNASVAPSLGRSLSGNAANVTVNLVTPGARLGDRVNQLDFRVAKILRFGHTRTNVGLDIYNLTNSAAVQTYNQSFIAGGSWLVPTLVMPSRFAKVSAQIDF